LIHVLPSGFHRIRYYGFFANTVRTDHLVKARALLNVPIEPSVTEESSNDKSSTPSPFTCPLCKAPMIVIEVFFRDHAPRAPPLENQRCAA